MQAPNAPPALTVFPTHRVIEQVPPAAIPRADLEDVSAQVANRVYQPAPAQNQTDIYDRRIQAPVLDPSAALVENNGRFSYQTPATAASVDESVAKITAVREAVGDADRGAKIFENAGNIDPAKVSAHQSKLLADVAARAEELEVLASVRSSLKTGGNYDNINKELNLSTNVNNVPEYVGSVRHEGGHMETDLGQGIIANANSMQWRPDGATVEGLQNIGNAQPHWQYFTDGYVSEEGGKALISSTEATRDLMKRISELINAGDDTAKTLAAAKLADVDIAMATAHLRITESILDHQSAVINQVESHLRNGGPIYQLPTEIPGVAQYGIPNNVSGMSGIQVFNIDARASQTEVADEILALIQAARNDNQRVADVAARQMQLIKDVEATGYIQEAIQNASAKPGPAAPRIITEPEVDVPLTDGHKVHLPERPAEVEAALKTGNLRKIIDADIKKPHDQQALQFPDYGNAEPIVGQYSVVENLIEEAPLAGIGGSVSHVVGTDVAAVVGFSQVNGVRILPNAELATEGLAALNKELPAHLQNSIGFYTPVVQTVETVEHGIVVKSYTSLVPNREYVESYTYQGLLPAGATIDHGLHDTDIHVLSALFKTNEQTAFIQVKVDAVLQFLGALEDLGKSNPSLSLVNQSISEIADGKEGIYAQMGSLIDSATGGITPKIAIQATAAQVPDKIYLGIQSALQTNMGSAVAEVEKVFTTGALANSLTTDGRALLEDYLQTLRQDPRMTQTLDLSNLRAHVDEKFEALQAAAARVLKRQGG